MKIPGKLIRLTVPVLLIGVLSAIVCLPASAGQTWDALDHWYLRSTLPIQKVRFVGGVFVGLGANGMLATSADGTSWTQRPTGTTAELKGVACNAQGNLWIAVGTGGAVLTSSDSTNWYKPFTLNLTNDMNDVAFKGGKFVATVTRNNSTEPNVLVSQYGTGWTGKTFPPSPNAPSNAYPFYMTAIVATTTNFIAVGGYWLGFDIWRSTNGNTWEYAANANVGSQGMAWGNSRLVIVGWEGWPCVSTNEGVSWFNSSAAEIWPYPPNQAPAMVGSDIAFGNSAFVVVRSWMQSLGNGLLVTSDGVNWSTRSAFSNPSLKAESIAYGKGAFVVACSPSGIYQSASVATPFLTFSKVAGADALNLQIQGEVGRAYRLQSSTDLANWSDVVSYTNTAPVMEFVEPITNTIVRQFYRAISP